MTLRDSSRTGECVIANSDRIVLSGDSLARQWGQKNNNQTPKRLYLETVGQMGGAHSYDNFRMK
jgi:hypothetical protein